jgi:cold shock CspA family protein
MKKQGIVMKWDSDKSFGFIRSVDTQSDIFFHRRDYSENRSPVEGLAVTFQEIHVGGKGPRALSVTPSLNAIVDAPPTPAPDDPAPLLSRAARAPRATPCM